MSALLIAVAFLVLTALAHAEETPGPGVGGATVTDDAPTPKSPKPAKKDPASKVTPNPKSGKKPVSPTTTRPTPKMPWAHGKKHTYTWVRGGVHVADTEFRIEEIKKNAGKSESGTRDTETSTTGYRVHSRLRWESEIQTRDLDRQYLFDRTWSLQSIETTDNLLYASQRSSNKIEKTWKEGSVLLTELRQNNDEPTRSEILLPGGAYVLPYDGVIVWALLMPLELPIDKSTDIRIGYPATGAVYDVRIRNRGSVRIKLLDGQAVNTIRYGFESKKRALFGDLWVDARGRVLRYQQGKLVIDLTSGSAKKK
jgi:hypothetical protein